MDRKGASTSRAQQLTLNRKDIHADALEAVARLSPSSLCQTMADPTPIQGQASIVAIDLKFCKTRMYNAQWKCRR